MDKKRKSTGRSGAQKSARQTPRKQGGKGRPFQPGNIWRIPPGTTLNPGGRPLKLSQAYAAALELESKDHPGLTNAQVIAALQVTMALAGSLDSAKELRIATEGETQKIEGTLATITADDMARAAEKAEAYEREKLNESPDVT